MRFATASVMSVMLFGQQAIFLEQVSRYSAATLASSVIDV
jgi:hypothetical protein